MKTRSKPAWLESLQDRLHRWARWRRKVNAVPTGDFRNPLARMQAEGATMDRAARNKRDVMETQNVLRASMLARIKAAEQVASEAEAQGKTVEAQMLRDMVMRLRQKLRALPKTVGALPWASMIHGVGMRPDADTSEEEETEAAYAALEGSLRRVVRVEYMDDGTQESKAATLRYDSVRTYKRRLDEAHMQLRWRLEPQD